MPPPKDAQGAEQAVTQSSHTLFRETEITLQIETQNIREELQFQLGQNQPLWAIKQQEPSQHRYLRNTATCYLTVSLTLNITQEIQSQPKHFRNHPEPYGTALLHTSGVKVSQSLLTN